MQHRDALVAEDEKDGVEPLDVFRPEKEGGCRLEGSNFAAPKPHDVVDTRLASTVRFSRESRVESPHRRGDEAVEAEKGHDKVVWGL